MIPMHKSMINTASLAEVEKRNLPVSFIKNQEVCKDAAFFLGVSAEGLEKSMCTKSTLTRGETIISPLSASQARDVCDAFVKGIYGRMFVWIVRKINEVIYKPKVSLQCVHSTNCTNRIAIFEIDKTKSCCIYVVNILRAFCWDR